MSEKEIKIFNRHGVSAFVSVSAEKTFLIFAFVLIFSISAFAQNTSVQKTEAQTMPADFKSDKCSLFPDCDYGDCCVEHDKKYYFGGSFKERRQADIKLYKCVRRKKGFHHKIIAPLMYVGVRIGGVSWLPTPFRWGFGKKKKPKNNMPSNENPKDKNSAKNRNGEIKNI